MKYLKTYEFFDFFKKKSIEPKEPLERLRWIFDNYKNFKKDKNVYSFHVDDRMGHWYISYMSKTSNFSLILEKSKKEEDKYYVKPFEGTKMGENIDITKSEFEEYSNKCEEIDEFLNQEDEKKNTSTVGEDGLDNLNISNTEEASYIITDVLKEHVGKEFEFDCMVYTWTNNSTNTHEVTPVLFKVSEFKLDVYGDLDEDSEKDTNFFVQIIVSNNVNKKLYNIWIDENTRAEWMDIKPLVTRKNAIVIYEYTDHLSRREKRKNDSYTYPLIKLGLQVAPTKYNSIELIKNVQEIIMLLQDRAKNK